MRIRDLVAGWFIWRLFEPRRYRSRTLPPPRTSGPPDAALGCLIVILVIVAIPEVMWIIHIIKEVIALPSKIRW
jgi:hypothetical protein